MTPLTHLHKPPGGEPQIHNVALRTPSKANGSDELL